MATEGGALLRDALEGQVVVVVGATGGIGSAITAAMARAGARVVAVGRDRAKGDALVRLLDASGLIAEYLTCDVEDDRGLDQVRDEVLVRWARVDAVVTTVGGRGPVTGFLASDRGQWRQSMALNLDSVYGVFHCFAPPMVEQRSGSLLALSSIAGRRARGGNPAYAAAKAGVVGLVRALAAELGPYGVRVNSVCPGPTATPRVLAGLEHEAADGGKSVSELARALSEDGPLGRLVSPDEVAAACVFLASSAASSVTGEDLNVSGGLIVY